MESNYYIQTVPCPTCGKCPTCGSYKPNTYGEITWTGTNTATYPPMSDEQWWENMKSLVAFRDKVEEANKDGK